MTFKKFQWVILRNGSSALILTVHRDGTYTVLPYDWLSVGQYDMGMATAVCRIDVSQIAQADERVFRTTPGKQVAKRYPDCSPFTWKN